MIAVLFLERHKGGEKKDPGLSLLYKLLQILCISMSFTPWASFHLELRLSRHLWLQPLQTVCAINGTQIFLSFEKKKTKTHNLFFTTYFSRRAQTHLCSWIISYKPTAGDWAASEIALRKCELKRREVRLEQRLVLYRTCDCGNIKGTQSLALYLYFKRQSGHGHSMKCQVS